MKRLVLLVLFALTTQCAWAKDITVPLIIETDPAYACPTEIHYVDRTIQELQERIDTLEMRILLLELMEDRPSRINDKALFES